MVGGIQQRLVNQRVEELEGYAIGAEHVVKASCVVGNRRTEIVPGGRLSLDLFCVELCIYQTVVAQIPVGQVLACFVVSFNGVEVAGYKDGTVVRRNQLVLECDQLLGLLLAGC